MTTGLGWVNARIEKFEKATGFRIPHMGWNNVKIVKETPLFKDFRGKPTFYFTHSYVMKNDNTEDIIAVAEYSEPITAAI